MNEIVLVKDFEGCGSLIYKVNDSQLKLLEALAKNNFITYEVCVNFEDLTENN